MFWWLKFEETGLYQNNMAAFNYFVKWTSKYRRKSLFGAQFGLSLINCKQHNLLLRNNLLPGVCLTRHFALKTFPWTQSMTGENLFIPSLKFSFLIQFIYCNYVIILLCSNQIALSTVFLRFLSIDHIWCRFLGFLRPVLLWWAGWAGWAG